MGHVEFLHDGVHTGGCRPEHKDESERQQSAFLFRNEVPDRPLEKSCGLGGQNLVQKIHNGLLHVGDGEVREQREDKDRAREDGEKKKIGESGRADEYAVVLNLVPQIL